MLELIDNCDEKDYEQLCDFLVNFCYEDTINSSFIQEELMLLIYLIFEKKIFEKLPQQIKTYNNEISFNIFRNKDNIFYYILRSLSRKADIRNFICSILVDSIIKLQDNRKLLAPNIFFLNDDLDEEILAEEEIDDTSETLSKRLSIQDNFFKELILNTEDKGRLNRSITISIYKSNFSDILNRRESNEKLNNNNNNNNEKENDIHFFADIDNNFSEEDLRNIDLDSFFEDNNVSSNYIQKKIKEYEHISRNNIINLAIKDYLNSLINDINESKEEIYSNKIIVKYLKSFKKRNEIDNKVSFDEIIEGIKTNYNTIIEIIEDILNKLKENLTSVPVIIKCISNIIEQLLNKKYCQKKSELLMNYYQKYSFKLNFFIGNIILSSLINPSYNGVFTSDLISKNTSKNLKIVYNILDKLLSGQLFTNDFDTLFNKYIIDIIPKIFEIIDNIEKNFKLPEVLQNLVNTCTDVNNEKRLKDFEYNYFYEKGENVQYQSMCLSLDNLVLLFNLAQKIEDKIKKVEQLQIMPKLLNYSSCLNDIIKKNGSSNKSEFVYFTKINYNDKIKNKINSILKDNFVGLGQSQNIDEFTYFKRCLVEILGFVNILDKIDFNFFTDNMKEIIHNYDIQKLLYTKNLSLEYKCIINDGSTNGLDKNIDEDKNMNFVDVLLPKIIEYIKCETGDNLDNPKNQRLLFCCLYIQSHLKSVPKDYIEKNYFKLFMELIRETFALFTYLNNNILNLLYNKIKEGNKLNLIITSNYMQIKSLEKFKCIEYLYSRILIPDKLKIKIDENSKIPMIEYEKEIPKKKEIKEMKNENENENEKKKEDNKFLNDFVVIDENAAKKEEIIKQENKPKNIHISTIINKIPDFRKFEETNDDLIKIEEKSGISSALKNFFKNLKIKIKSEKIIKRFCKEDIESISHEFENYILSKLYDKLYPTKSSKEDIIFYKKCCRLNFIKPDNIISDKNIYNEQLWKISIDYLNEIDKKFTPQNKIKTVLKSFGILQNSITFCSGKKELGVDDTIKPLIYVLIKSKPKNIYSNFNYSQMYINDNLAKTQYGILLTQLCMIMKIIKEMKYNELIGVTEEEFGKDEEI
jgi:hypothetical protein